MRKEAIAGMVFEQELASIISFALIAAGGPKPYYYNVPEQFEHPAMFFPQPEINTRGETFNSYAMEYVWYVNVFCETTEEAYRLANAVLVALKDARNLVPLIDTSRTATGEMLRLNDPSIKPVDSGVVQIALSWTSRRPYDCDLVQKMMHWDVEGWSNPDIYNTVSVKAAFSRAVDNYLADYPRQEQAQAGKGI